MPSVTLKNIPKDLHQRLKLRAEEHERSLNSEIIACLRAAVEPRKIDVEAELARMRELRSRMRGSLNDAMLEQARRQGRP